MLLPFAAHHTEAHPLREKILGGRQSLLPPRHQPTFVAEHQYQFPSPSLPKSSQYIILRGVMGKVTYPTLTVTKAQSGLPKLCRDKKPILITTHNKPVSVLLPIEDYDALIETMDLLANPKAMRTLRAAKAGKLKYRALNLKDENLGL
jgi:PHD/YefM family antitoxin component YafN of YafNO toxin-antitoxin module